MKSFIYTVCALTIVFFSSCTKKQVKKATDEIKTEQTTSQSTILPSTSTISEIYDDTKTITEADVRKETKASLQTIYFDFDKYNIKPEYSDILAKNAKIIIENNYSIIIEGHCDERGTEQYNLSLGQKRANAVKEYYIKLGVNPLKIATISYGEEMPVCYEHNEDCWALNRRAETKITE